MLHSPERVELHLPIAGPGSRILAYAIDAVVVALLMLLLVTTLLLTTGLAETLASSLEWADSADPDELAELPMSPLFVLAFMLFGVVVASIETLYFLAWELGSGGQSLGKKILGLRVLQDGGLPIEPRSSLVRNLLRVVDQLPMNYLVGLCAILVSRDGKRLGDLAAGTIVVRMDRPLAAMPIEVPSPAERAAFPFSAVQVGRLGADELRLLRQTLRRLDALDPERSAALLDRTVAVLCQRLEHAEVPVRERRTFLRALLAAAETHL